MTHNRKRKLKDLEDAESNKPATTSGAKTHQKRVRKSRKIIVEDEDKASFIVVDTREVQSANSSMKTIVLDKDTVLDNDGQVEAEMSILPGMQRGGEVDTIDFDPQSIMALTQQTNSKHEDKSK